MIEQKYLIAAAIALTSEGMVRKFGGIVPPFIEKEAEQLATQLQALTEIIVISPEPPAEDTATNEPATETPAASDEPQTSEAATETPAASSDATQTNEPAAATETPATSNDAAQTETSAPATASEPATETPAASSDAAQTSEPATTTETPAASDNSTPTNEPAAANEPAAETPADSTDATDNKRGVSDADLLNILQDKESKGRSLDLSIAAYLYGEDAVKDGEITDIMNKNRIGYIKGQITRYFKSL